MRWNTEIFIKKAVEKHGDFYDYTNVVCNTSTDKVEIICPKHGTFFQQARCHIKGQQCPKCAQENKNNSKSNLEYFLKKLGNKYGNTIDYSKAEYIDSNTPICIICHEKDENGIEHGEFWQTPHNHLYNRGCEKCKSEKSSRNSHKKMTLDEFTKKAKRIHGDKYDYGKVNYINNRTNVCIICPKHGEFWQSPTSHLKGQGCPRCSKPVHDTESFINKSKEIHCYKYDYSKVDYINNYTKVCIICPIHGEFWVRPSSFNRNKPNECPKCQKAKKDASQTSTTKEFIEKARKLYGDKYDYSKVVYVNNRAKVCMICPIHGEFWMAPHKHLMGEECPKCSVSHLERDVMRLLDNNGIKYSMEFSPKWAHRKRYDFHIEGTNILIECQGEQHYTPVDFANKGKEWAENAFRKIIENDEKKKEYAEDNGYKIIYYTDLPHKKFNEITNLEEILVVIKHVKLT